MKEVRIIGSSDWHLRMATPECRTDDFSLTQVKKVKQVLAECKKFKADALCIAGDVFDSAFVSHGLVRRIIRIFRRLLPSHTKLCVVYGQHDLRYHSLKNKHNSPLSVLLASLDAFPVSDKPVIINDFVAIQGADFSQPIPDPIERMFNILVIHRMVIKTRKLWKGQQDFITAARLLKESGYDIVISGDNHQQFHLTYKGKLLINNGPLVRLTIADYDHTPACSLITIREDGTYDFEWKYLNIMEARKVLKEPEDTKFNKNVKEFVDAIYSISDKSVDFMQILQENLNKESVDKSIKYWINKIVEIYDNQHNKRLE